MSTLKCVLYTAQWCQPCKIFKQRYWQSLQEEFPHVQFQTIDVETEVVDIDSIPTLRIWRDLKRPKTFRDVFSQIKEIRKYLK